MKEIYNIFGQMNKNFSEIGKKKQNMAPKIGHGV